MLHGLEGREVLDPAIFRILKVGRGYAAEIPIRHA